MIKSKVESIKKSIGKRVKQARKMQKISQFELAKKSDCTPQTIINIEGGNTNCNIETLIKIKQELNIEELFI